jgi:hypothetical protein
MVSKRTEQFAADAAGGLLTLHHLMLPRAEIIPQMVPAAVVLARMEAAAEQPQQPPEQQHQQPGAPTEQLANP